MVPEPIFAAISTDDVLYTILQYLPLVHTVLLTSTSASLSVQLAGTPAAVSSGVSSTVERLAAFYVGSEVTAACAKSFALQRLTSSWPLLMVRALTGTFPKALALRQAVELASSGPSDSSMLLQSAKSFLEAVFHAETCSRGPSQDIAAVGDLALKAIISSCRSGPRLILVSAEAVQQAEEKLDAMFDEGREHIGEYEAIARQRSAAKLILKRLGKDSGHLSADLAVAAATQRLETTIESLDRTVDSYRSEGHWHSGVYNFISFGLGR